jgi:predicted nuclease of predicted toxin-antitoxin system
MKLLIDENLPHKLRHALSGHDCFTTTYMGWSGISNGELLRIAAANGFDAVISNDRGLEYQQNQATLPLSVVVLLTKDNKQAQNDRVHGAGADRGSERFKAEKLR